MNTKEIDKKYKVYSKYYKNLLINEGIKEVDERMASSYDISDIKYIEPIADYLVGMNKEKAV